MYGSRELRHIVRLGLLSVLVLALAACGGPTTVVSPTPTLPPTPTPTATPKPTSTSTPTPTPTETSTPTPTPDAKIQHLQELLTLENEPVSGQAVVPFIYISSNEIDGNLAEIQKRYPFEIQNEDPTQIQELMVQIVVYDLLDMYEQVTGKVGVKEQVWELLEEGKIKIVYSIDQVAVPFPDMTGLLRLYNPIVIIQKGENGIEVVALNEEGAGLLAQPKHWAVQTHRGQEAWRANLDLYGGLPNGPRHIGMTNEEISPIKTTLGLVNTANSQPIWVAQFATKADLSRTGGFNAWINTEITRATPEQVHELLKYIMNDHEIANSK